MNKITSLSIVISFCFSPLAHSMEKAIAEIIHRNLAFDEEHQHDEYYVGQFKQLLKSESSLIQQILQENNQEDRNPRCSEEVLASLGQLYYLNNTYLPAILAQQSTTLHEKLQDYIFTNKIILRVSNQLMLEGKIELEMHTRFQTFHQQLIALRKELYSSSEEPPLHYKKKTAAL